jgi:hypothetical protein
MQKQQQAKAKPRKQLFLLKQVFLLKQKQQA